MSSILWVEWSGEVVGGKKKKVLMMEMLILLFLLVLMFFCRYPLEDMRVCEGVSTIRGLSDGELEIVYLICLLSVCRCPWDLGVVSFVYCGPSECEHKLLWAEWSDDYVFCTFALVMFTCWAIFIVLVSYWISSITWVQGIRVSSSSLLEYVANGVHLCWLHTWFLATPWVGLRSLSFRIALDVICMMLGIFGIGLLITIWCYVIFFSSFDVCNFDPCILLFLF